MAKKKIVYEETWRAKWLGDGAETLREIAERLRAEADRLDKMAVAGVTLRDSVGDDYGFMETSDPAVAKEFGFVNVGELERAQGAAQRAGKSDAIEAAFKSVKSGKKLTEAEEHLTGFYYPGAP